MERFGRLSGAGPSGGTRPPAKQLSIQYDALPLDAAWEIVEAPNGDIWMGNQGWMARFDGEWTLFEFDRTNPPMGPEGFDSEGNVWSVEPMSAIGRFDGSRWETFSLPRTRAVLVDPLTFAVRTRRDRVGGRGVGAGSSHTNHL